MSETVLFKGNEVSIDVKEDPSRNLEKELIADSMVAIGVAIRKRTSSASGGVSDYYRYGVLLEIRSIKRENGFFYINVKALQRVKILNFVQMDTGIKAEYAMSDVEVDLPQQALNEIFNTIKQQMMEISVYTKGIDSFISYVENIKDIEQVSGLILQYLNVSTDDRQRVLEAKTMSEMGLRLIDTLIKQKEFYRFQKEVGDKFSQEANKNYRKAFLREQLKAIQDELDDEPQSQKNKKEYATRIDESAMPPDVKEVAKTELLKYDALPQQSNEKSVVGNYLDLLLALPWEKTEAQEIDIAMAKTILDEDHYGLKEVKERIIQHLAVLKLKKDKQGTILLLLGPPGTGKTSLGRSIARALNRPYVRVSLGGMRDEAEIRGHRRTYVAALPGRIIQGMKKAGATNPIFVLDEIDKLQVGNSGDPASALLEVLDPEQNNTFADHYLEVPFDLSDVFFIATANSAKTIPGPLLDRMEVIELSSYTSLEKFHIASEHLVCEVVESVGLTKTDLRFEDETIRHLIEDYTRESGVRGLKRVMTTVARVVSEKIVTDEVQIPYTVVSQQLDELIGKPLVKTNLAGQNNPIGVVTGLAWTPVGGDILFIEGAFIKGTGQLILTGNLGDVMKESARIALSLVKSRLGKYADDFDFGSKDLHLHVPSGAIQKDGPSAGTALFSVIASLVTQLKVPSDLAMTGEITLSGRILPVGGIKEKIIAAHRSGVNWVILPKENERDLEDVPVEVREGLHFQLVSTIEEVLYAIFGFDIINGLLIQDPVSKMHGITSSGERENRSVPFHMKPNE